MLALQREPQTIKEKFNIEIFDSGYEVVDVSKNREMTSSCFDNKRTGYYNVGWEGVKTWDEAQELMATGYQPVVDSLKNIKINLKGDSKRVRFKNDLVGFQPIVPLYLMGVPNCMVNTQVKNIKTRVLNIYYNMTVACRYSAEQLEEAGKKLLSAVMELEMQGYRFNLSAFQTYYAAKEGCDMLIVNLKNSNTPMDLKRMSFQLSHPAFFRVVGFDWYSRTPKGKYRSAYGKSISYDYDDNKVADCMEEMLGKPCVVISATKIIDSDTEYIKELLTKGQEKAKK